MPEDTLEAHQPSTSKTSRRTFFKAGATVGVAVAAKPALETVGKALENIADFLTEAMLTEAQKKARRKLIEAVRTQKELVTNLIALDAGDRKINLRAYPAAYFGGEGDTTGLGNLEPGTKIPFAIKEMGEDPEHPGAKGIWYAFPMPGSNRPLEKAQIVFVWNEYLKPDQTKTETAK